MSLSTSSSNHIYRKVLLAIILGMATALGIIRTITYLIDATGDSFLGRVQEARAALPKIVKENDDLVMVFGSSMVEAGFSARQFDRELGEKGIQVKSFNFGFGGLNPYFQDYLSRRIGESFVNNDRRLKLAIIEFNPFQTTQSRYQGSVPIIDSFITLLASDQELLEIALKDPERGALLFNIKYLRDNVSAQMISSFFGRSFRPSPPRSTLDEDQEISKLRRELGEQLTKAFEAEYPDYVPSDWSYEWQGAGTIPTERTAETLAIFPQYFATLRTPRLLENDRNQRVFCCDIIELHFEEILIKSFIRLVKNFQQFSDQVEVVMLPRNTAWINYPPAAKQRLRQVLSRIEAETGVKIKDFQDIPAITPEMFSDTTHLARYLGDVPFTHFLAETYSSQLAQ